MEDKALKKLSRSDLLEIMISVSKENEALQIENNQLKQALQQRKIALDNAGSIAKASLEINGVMESAQKAADQYLFNIKAMADDIKGKIRDEIINAQKEADEIRAKALRDAEVIRAGGTPTQAAAGRSSPSAAAKPSPSPAPTAAAKPSPSSAPAAAAKPASAPAAQPMQQQSAMDLMKKMQGKQ